MDASPTRLVLDDVPLIGFWPDVHGKPGAAPGPEDVCFATCLRATAQHDGRAFDYIEALGFTGSGFRLVWNPGRWDPAQDCAHLACEDSLEPYRRGAAAAGYNLRALRNPSSLAPAGYQDTTAWDADIDEAQAVDALRASLAAGLPVIAVGVVGPPEPCLIAGVDDGGATVVGWSCFQYDPQFAAGLGSQANGMFRREDWWPACAGLLVLDRREAADLASLDHEAIDFALRMLSVPETHGSRLGIAAYDAWIADLATEPDDAGDLAEWGRRAMIHMIAVGCIAEGRWYAGQWLARVAGRHPKVAEPLFHAAAEAAAIHSLSWQLWSASGSFGEGDAPAASLSRPEARHEASALLRRCQEHDRRLAERLAEVVGVWRAR